MADTNDKGSGAPSLSRISGGGEGVAHFKRSSTRSANPFEGSARLLLRSSVMVEIFELKMLLGQEIRGW